MRNYICLIFFLACPGYANDCGPLFEKVALYHSPHLNFSNRLIDTVFDQEKLFETTPLFTTRISLSNLGIALKNALTGLVKMDFYGDVLYLPYNKKPSIKAFREAAQYLTPFGQLYAQNTKDRRIIDLGAGNLRLSSVPRVLAQVFGARSYIGVDRFARTRKFRKEFDSPFDAQFIKQDILPYLQDLAKNRFKDTSPIMFFLEGIEHQSEVAGSQDATQAYLKEVIETVQMASRPGDSLFIGGTVSFLHPASDYDPWNRNDAIPKRQFELAIDPAKYGFKRIASERLLGSHVDPEIRSVNSHHDLWIYAP